MGKRTWISYENYIKSEEWKTRRNTFMSSLMHRSTCNVCGATKNLHVHHRTYKNLGNEADNHLVTLCKKHHKECHDYIKANNYDLYNGTSWYIGEKTNCRRGVVKKKKKNKVKKDGLQKLYNEKAMHSMEQEKMKKIQDKLNKSVQLNEYQAEYLIEILLECLEDPVAKIIIDKLTTLKNNIST